MAHSNNTQNRRRVQDTTLPHATNNWKLIVVSKIILDLANLIFQIVLMIKCRNQMFGNAMCANSTQRNANPRDQTHWIKLGKSTTLKGLQPMPSVRSYLFLTHVLVSAVHVENRPVPQVDVRPGPFNMKQYQAGKQICSSN